jgi:hypothetical protein
MGVGPEERPILVDGSEGAVVAVEGPGPHLGDGRQRSSSPESTIDSASVRIPDQ